MALDHRIRQRPPPRGPTTARPTPLAPPPPHRPSGLTTGRPPLAGGARLYADGLPRPTWGSNIRTLVDRATWDALRIPVARAADGRCEVCGDVSTDERGRQRRPDCHERWVFETAEDGRAVQRLQRLVALCRRCHQVQHCDLARSRGKTGEVVDQLMSVNGWTPDEARAEIARAETVAAARAVRDWDLDLSLLHGVIEVEGHPTLYFFAADR